MSCTDSSPKQQPSNSGDQNIPTRGLAQEILTEEVENRTQIFVFLQSAVEDSDYFLGLGSHRNQKYFHRNSLPLQPHYNGALLLKSSLHTRCIIISWELVRNAKFQAQPKPTIPESAFKQEPPGDSYAHGLGYISC